MSRSGDCAKTPRRAGTLVDGGSASDIYNNGLRGMAFGSLLGSLVGGASRAAGFAWKRLSLEIRSRTPLPSRIDRSEAEALAEGQLFKIGHSQDGLRVIERVMAEGPCGGPAGSAHRGAPRGAERRGEASVECAADVGEGRIASRERPQPADA